MFFRSAVPDPVMSSPSEVDEKAPTADFAYPVPGFNGEGGIVDSRERNLSRSLSQRHIQMIALAGAIVRYHRCHASLPFED
jgi:hypothetical protein